MIYLQLITVLLLLVIICQRGIKLRAINNLRRRLEELMANQEERLKAILVGVKEAVRLLNELKTNNPQIEDEITEIEGVLAGTPPAEDPPA